MVEKLLKTSGLVLVASLAIAQFIRPEKNISELSHDEDIATYYNVPEEIQTLLKTSCYDCHSNTTRYPWYAELQPVGWWLSNHIKEGKREMNFSEFAGKNLRWQYRKLEEIAEQVDEEEMPLPSYLLAHAEARLTQQQRDKLISWTEEMRQTLKAGNPEEQFERKK